MEFLWSLCNLKDIGHIEQGIISQVLWHFWSQTLLTACPLSRPNAIHICIKSLTEQFDTDRLYRYRYADADTNTWKQPYNFLLDQFLYEYGYSDTDTYIWKSSHTPHCMCIIFNDNILKSPNSDTGSSTTRCLTFSLVNMKKRIVHKTHTDVLA